MAEDPIVKFLMALSQAWRNLTFYPPGHPGLAGAAERVAQAYGPLFSSTDVIELVCGREGFSAGGKAVAEGNPQLRKMGQEFFVRKIKSIFLHRGASGEELVRFLRVLLQSREQLNSGGGVEPFLESQSVSHVRVNEADFAHLRAVLEEDDDEGIVPVEEGGARPALDPEIEPMRKELSSLLFDLNRHSNPVSYLNLMRKILHIAKALREKGLLDPTLQALQVLIYQRDNPALGRERSLMAAEAVSNLFDESVMDYLIEKAVRLSDYEVEEAGRVLQMISPATASSMWSRFDAAADSGNAAETAALGRLLAWMGPEAKAEAARRMESGAVSPGLLDMLMAMPDPPSLLPLRRTLIRGDATLRAATRRMLAKLATEESLRLLFQALETSPVDEVGAVVSALGALDRPEWRPRLAALLTRPVEPASERTLAILQGVLHIASLHPAPAFREPLIQLGTALAAASKETRQRLGPGLMAASGAVGGTAALSLLASGVDDEEEETRSAAWEALADDFLWIESQPGEGA